MLSLSQLFHSLLSIIQGKLDGQARDGRNINILGISELKWMGIVKFNSDDRYVYYGGQESLRRNGVVLIVNRRV